MTNPKRLPVFPIVIAAAVVLLILSSIFKGGNVQSPGWPLLSPFGACRTDEKTIPKKEFYLPNTPTGIAANKSISDGNDIVILTINDEEEKHETLKKIIVEVIASNSLTSKPAKFFIVKKTDIAEEDLISFIGIKEFPAVTIVSNQGIAGNLSGEIDNEKILDFLHKNLR